jgi:hypothetical protein
MIGFCFNTAFSQQPTNQIQLLTKQNIDILGSAYIINGKREVLTLNIGMIQFNDGNPLQENSEWSRWKIDYLNFLGKYPAKCTMEILNLYKDGVNLSYYSFLEDNIRLIKEDWENGILDLAVLWPTTYGSWPKKGLKYENGETPLTIKIRFNHSGGIISVTGAALVKSVNDSTHIIQQTFVNYEHSVTVNIPFDFYGKPKI